MKGQGIANVCATWRTRGVISLETGGGRLDRGVGLGVETGRGGESEAGEGWIVRTKTLKTAEEVLRKEATPLAAPSVHPMKLREAAIETTSTDSTSRRRAQRPKEERRKQEVTILEESMKWVEMEDMREGEIDG